MEYNVHTLPNGIRLLHVPSASAISHACIIVNSGSRDETESQAGLAHFIEHLIFKRTEKRNTNQILNRLESVGADLNAYTTKEYTCIHASFLHPYLDRTLELFNDIVFHSTFPEEEMEKEKGVILDEIASYLDQPEEAIYDDFEDMVFADHSLGRNILGTTESVNKLSQQDIKDFIAANYSTDKIVIAVLGNYSLPKAVKIFTKYYEAIPENIQLENRKAPATSAVITRIDQKPIMQAHTMIGSTAYSLHHPFKTGLLLLNNLLCGTGMSSILNLQIREKHGIAYSIESGYSPLSDTGIFTLYFGTDKEKVNRAQSLIYKEFKKIRENPLTEVQLQKAKNKFIGQIALGEENRIGLIVSMAKSLIDYNKIDSLETVFEKIEAVNTADMAQIADEILDEKNLSVLTFYPLG
ncbi:putative Zn-dependent peptidase [Pedobacter cryoconitis]|uniref:Putative Zn-dependent peptidase n=1 Tax=Pedobacter cryoconitis TaxID=188932 RepID=A0A7W9DY48_9SPHI|nr:pitrilysin family protein [Pedobacter cryoconitis]MBB5635541.1 putative Zn-dependent peptidase [Pedobacter cryoconitis]